MTQAATLAQLASSGALYADTSGNVAIGATTTGVKLNVSQVDTSVGVLFNGTTRAVRFGFNTTGSSIEGVDNTGVTSYQPLTIGGADVRFATSGTERMRIDSSGNLLLNMTSSINGFNWLNVQASNAKNGIGINTLSNTGTTYFAAWYVNTTNIGYISTSTYTSVVYATSSDYRLKEDIQPMQNALATVAQLKPVTYKWKSTGGDGQGFIAHELQAVVPEAVVGEKDAVDEEGNPKYQGVDTSFLVATLTAALQELKAELDVCKAEIAALKGV